MKRCLILVTSFMLLLGASAFADNVFFQKQGGGDSLYIGQSAVIEMYAQTNALSDACSFGLTFNFTAGGALTFDNTYGNGSVGTTPTQGQLYLRRHGDAITGFDLLFAGNATSFLGLGLPDALSFGGSKLSAGYPAQATPALFVSFKVNVPDDGSNVDTQGGFCINPAADAANGVTWEFTQGGAAPPDFNGTPTGSASNPQAPAQCWDVVFQPCIPPAFTATPNASVNHSHCTPYTFDFDANPVDPSGTPGVTFSTSAGTINASTGQLSVPAISSCGSTDVTVTVTNQCGSTADYPFTITWTNNNPSITNCPANFQVGKGNAVARDINATDADPCDALVWSVVANDAVVNAPTIDGTGNFAWTSDNSEGGSTKSFTVTVTDQCGGTSNCTFSVDVLNTQPFLIHIDKVHNALQGHYAYVSILKVFGSGEMGGYDFLVGYDASALSFISATLGADLGPAGLGWEYFTYRYGAFGNCNGPCPSGKLRVVAIADQNNGANHPSGFAVPDGGELASLKFYVTNDRNFECQKIPIRFCWVDCGDNGISNIGGDTLWISDQVYDWNNQAPDQLDTPENAPWNITDPSCYFAMSMGGACSDCDVSLKYEPNRFINFWNGGIDIVCADSIDGRGDINLNGILNEIADAVLYTNYFLYGFNALDSNPQFREAQIAASDVNADGVPLTVGDLVYQLRVIVGDALPFPKLAPFANTANVTLAHGTLSTESSVDLGAVYATFNVNGAYDVVSHTDMDVLSAENDGQLKVLVYAGTTNMTNAINAGTADLFTVNGDVDLVSVEVADYSGNMLNAQVNKSVLPTSFALHQNVPNPFNPTTKIGLDLPTASDWSLSIYNVAGQLVKSFNGNGVGTVNVEWDASNVASGIYFYKATVADWTQTKKMVLMK